MLKAFRLTQENIDKLILVKERKKLKDDSKAIRFCIEYTEINTRGD